MGDGRRRMRTERDIALEVVQDTVRRHGLTVIDSEELLLLRMDLAATREALTAMLCEPTDSSRDRARRVLARRGGEVAVLRS